MTALTAFGYFCCGGVLWTLLEYGLHRFIGHAWNTRLRARHLEHHNNPETYSFDWHWLALGFLVVLMGAAITPQLGWIAMGLTVGYLRYEHAHWEIHRVPRTLCRHWAHHQEITANFGVTTSLWDRLLGTYL